MIATDISKHEILDLVGEYAHEHWPEREFRPGIDPVPYAGRVFDSREVMSLVNAALDFWLTAGPEAAKFERKLAGYVGVKHACFCNSGSSANLLAVSALTAQELGERRIKPGDEVITVAAGFPTTVNPIVQVGAVPVFVDIDPDTLNIDHDGFIRAFSKKTRAVMLAHTLGNPFDVGFIKDFCDRYGWWLIEDACDALGGLYRGKRIGSFGDLATCSFYPSHHITTGEGGAVFTSRSQLKVLVESFRDWGRDCWCEPGCDNTCGKRYTSQHGSLPYGYDHKFTYSHVGYNLKATDLQAAIGVAQMDRLDEFVTLRRRNWAYLRQALDSCGDVLDFVTPTEHSEPSWFGFAMTVKDRAPFTRDDLVKHLDESKVSTRMLFGGDLTRQPAYAEVRYRQVGTLPVTTRVMNQTLWVGVYPGLTPSMLEYMAETITEFCRR